MFSTIEHTLARLGRLGSWKWFVILYLLGLIIFGGFIFLMHLITACLIAL